MKFLRKFNEHTSYEAELNVGGIEISLPNVSYCEDVKDVHYTPYNLVRFYVGEITPPQTVNIYTDATNHLDVTVSDGNKWYSYLLPKNKGLFKIEGDSVKKVVVKSDITTSTETIIPPLSTIEASFKGSNTSKVTDMSNMFSFCNDLTSLDLSGWNTNNVIDMRYMFYGCGNLTSLDVSNFDTSKVTNMSYMFSDCSCLTKLDVSNFDTSNVTSMYSMFSGCSGLKSLDLSSFNTTNVNDMEDMFNGCRALTSLDLSGWDISNLDNMNGMFSNCISLTTIRMVRCSPETIQKITDVKPSSATIVTGQTI